MEFLAPLAVPDTGSLDLGAFAQYGVLGVIAAMLVFFARNAHQRERDRADRKEAEVERLHQLILDRIIPALTSATKAAEESAELLNAIQRERELAALGRAKRAKDDP